MFIAALFTVVNTERQPKCPQLDDWVEKMWCIYTSEYYAAIRRQEVPPFVTPCLDLENIMLKWNKSDRKS